MEVGVNYFLIQARMSSKQLRKTTNKH